jgi:invasion protein IalB
MRRIALSCVATAVACLVTTSAIAEEGSSSGLTYSPWTKFCLDDTCFVGRDGRSDCGPVVGATLIERSGDTKKTLRVTLPNRVSQERGVRIIIDDGQAIERPYVNCFANGCMADHDAGAEFVDQLKQGRMLVLEAVDKANSPIRLAVPLTVSPAHITAPDQRRKCTWTCAQQSRYRRAWIKQGAQTRSANRGAKRSSASFASRLQLNRPRLVDPAG